MVQQTNDYADVYVTPAEMTAVIGVILASGVVYQSKRRDYWSNNPLKRNEAISNSISCRRFEEVFSKLHFIPNTALPQKDKFQKVRLLIKMLNDNFLKHCPDMNMFSVDESMVPYFGRHGCKQFIRGKPIRFGFKIWVLATKTGYCVQLQPYPGLAEQQGDDYDLSSSSNIVYFFGKILRNHFPDKQLFITMDNYFTSLPLLKLMKENLQIEGTGTIRKNRIPSYPFREVKLRERGDMTEKYSSEHGVSLVMWHDNSDVLVASTASGMEPIASTTRFCRREKKKVTVQRPASVGLYNSTMGGVDLLDANVSNCRVAIRGKNGTTQYFCT